MIIMSQKEFESIIKNITETEKLKTLYEVRDMLPAMFEPHDEFELGQVKIIKTVRSRVCNKIFELKYSDKP